MYTVKQLSDLAEVSIRTLHHYDQIGLLPPSKVGTNGYRYYDEAALLRLQQILFYREIGLELKQIKDILDSPDFDLQAALRSHRGVLQEKVKRLQNLVHTVDNTLMHLAGEIDMSKKQLFEAFSDEKQKDYEREVRLQWGPDSVNESVKRWGGYSDAQRAAIQAEGGEIYMDMAKVMTERELSAEYRGTGYIGAMAQSHSLLLRAEPGYFAWVGRNIQYTSRFHRIFRESASRPARIFAGGNHTVRG